MPRFTDFPDDFRCPYQAAVPIWRGCPPTGSSSAIKTWRAPNASTNINWRNCTRNCWRSTSGASSWNWKGPAILSGPHQNQGQGTGPGTGPAQRPRRRPWRAGRAKKCTTLCAANSAPFAANRCTTPKPRPSANASWARSESNSSPASAGPTSRPPITRPSAVCGPWSSCAKSSWEPAPSTGWKIIPFVETCSESFRSPRQNRSVFAIPLSRLPLFCSPSAFSI